MQYLNEHPCLPTKYSTQNLEITKEQNQSSNALPRAKYAIYQKQVISSFNFQPKKNIPKKKKKKTS